MRKGFLMVLAVVLVAAMAAPAMATDLQRPGSSGSRDTRNRTIRRALGRCLHPPGKDVVTASDVEQRMRFIFDWKGENVGARYYGEIDYSQCGDSAYNTSRNQGGGLEADTVNLESKNILHVVQRPQHLREGDGGHAEPADSFGGMIFGFADMAGIFVTGNAEPMSYRLGWRSSRKTTTGSTMTSTSTSPRRSSPPRRTRRSGWTSMSSGCLRKQTALPTGRRTSAGRACGLLRIMGARSHLDV